jgi:hypothetical protein
MSMVCFTVITFHTYFRRKDLKYYHYTENLCVQFLLGRNSFRGRIRCSDSDPDPRIIILLASAHCSLLFR